MDFDIFRGYIRSLVSVRYPQPIWIDSLYGNTYHEYITLIAETLSIPEMNQLIIVKRDDKKNIGIKEMGELKNFLLNQGLYAKHKLVVINNADFLSIEAQNTILKTIEESPQHTLIVLITYYGRLIPTLTSRCIRVSMPRISQKLNDIFIHDILEYISVIQGSSVNQYRYIDTIVNRDIEYYLYIWEYSMYHLWLAKTNKEKYNDTMFNHTIGDRVNIDAFPLEAVIDIFMYIMTIKTELLFSNVNSTLVLQSMFTKFTYIV